MSRPSLFFFVSVVVILGPLHFHMNFGMNLSIFAQKLAVIDRNCIESIDKFGEYCHFNNIDCPIQEHGMSSHLFRSFKISFKMSYSFQCTAFALFFFS